MATNRDKRRAGLIDARRLLVTRLRARGLSMREITDAVARNGQLNPETNEPWDLATVFRDCQALQQQWLEQTKAVVAEHRARQLAELAEVKREAWSTKQLKPVLDALRQEAKLLGLEAPDRHELSTSGEQRVRIVEVEGPDPTDDGAAPASAAQPSSADAAAPGSSSR
jgi:DNA-binding transcriptional MerR regulator